MEEIKYRIYFYRVGEDKPFHSCTCWSKFGSGAAISYIRDLFKLTDKTILKAEEVTVPT